ncbi:FAD-dependent monooxygenase [Mycolicibacterium sp. GF69]|uniref:FAD-dependent oxidoreductase n=1 Tax=Mycolicibacterium sp. GF69 TaxID=2267251 RepID=UPI000DCF45C8|nr:NAD(P)/FAD-dependent oxidoreductase [Mycolicibacterium sp. GF69]RAV11975.1 FAD-dependent monooxygenase [Mycolicibacterium sp. GF69]
MLSPTSLEKQYELAAEDDLRILVVGAGIAGVTVAQLLRRSGRHPVLIERAESSQSQGYMLALMPMVDAALDDLGVREKYRAASVPLERYAVHGHTGRKLREDSMSAILARFGDYRGIARGELIDVLSGERGAVTYDSKVVELTERTDGVTVSVSTVDGTRSLDFDLVIVADGMHSDTRQLVLGERSVQQVDTNWCGWVVWAPEDASDVGEEWWGAGYFVGLYPVKGELGVFFGGPRADTAAGPASFIESIHRELQEVSPRLAGALTAVLEDPDPYYWSLTDCRAPEWTTGRTVLLGDAAAGFLPTAGIGAGMAMESAWVLATMLRQSSGSLADLLNAYENLQRPRVEAAQDNSRQLANLMFRRSRVLAVARELAMRFISVERALRPIQRLLHEQPDPDALVEAAQGTSVRPNAL